MTEPERTTHIFPIGKHRGEPIELVMADRQYVEWIMAQPWFREKYAPIYNIMVQGGEKQDCTPEHNALQNLFLLERHLHAAKLAALILKRENELTSGEVLAPGGRRKRESIINGAFGVKVLWRQGERENWDAVFRVSEDWIIKERWDSGEWGEWVVEEREHFICVEVKPVLGDDYPAVLRKMIGRREASNRRCGYYNNTVLVVGRFDSMVTSLADLKEIFSQSGIRVATVAEIEAVNLITKEEALASL